MWESSKFFSDKYISIGWNLNFANSFPHCDYVACDTETKLYYDGELLSEDKAYELYRDNGQQWVRNNLEVKAYAFMISDGENFALFQNATDFLTCLSMLNVKGYFGITQDSTLQYSIIISCRMVGKIFLLRLKKRNVIRKCRQTLFNH